MRTGAALLPLQQTRELTWCNAPPMVPPAGQFFECIVLKNMRPNVPEDMPRDYSLLMLSCWATNPADRPSADRLLDCISLMLQDRRDELGDECWSRGSSQHNSGCWAAHADAAAEAGPGAAGAGLSTAAAPQGSLAAPGAAELSHTSGVGAVNVSAGRALAAAAAAGAVLVAGGGVASLPAAMPAAPPAAAAAASPLGEDVVGRDGDDSSSGVSLHLT